MSDPDLLQRYVETGSQEAFAALVKRHLDLVYSAARRQVRSPQLAEEVAQSVFLDLSRQAHTLQPGAPLAAWLYLVTRRTSIDVIRRESRRQAREQTAVAIAAMNTSPPAWTQVEPLLDEAMDSLDATDRSAVLLRYFENQSLREVGQSLGTSEDAAQKRVSRAVDQLRLFFTKRGVAVTAAGLATDLSANAIQTAPLTLGASISAATVIAVGTSATSPAVFAELTKIAAMTTLKKIALATAFAVALGTNLYQISLLYAQQDGLDSARAQYKGLGARLDELKRQNLAANRSLAQNQRQIETLQNAAAAKAGTDPALEAEMRAWYAREDAIKQAFEQNPQLKIPELQLLTEKDWFSAAQAVKMETDEEMRETLSTLRNTAKNKLAQLMMKVLQDYTQAHDGTLPDNPGQLLPFFSPPVDPAILDRYEMLHTGKVSDLPSGNARMVLEERDSVDPEHDSHWQFGLNGMSSGSVLSWAVLAAQKNYAAEHAGRRATEPAQLQPYLKMPVDLAKLQPFFRH